MIVAFPPRAANDNEPREVWTCYSCDSPHFILECVAEQTLIRCGMCNRDVTENIMPTLGGLGAIDQCRQ